MTTVASLTRAHARPTPFAYLDEHSKRELRRGLLKALAMPGRQVPFASREMPVARGWGSGGLQVTLSLVGPHDVVKVIDQGDDASLNAVGMRELIARSSGARTTTRTREATIIQSRHRVPELPLSADQVLVLQVPHPEPLRRVVPDLEECAQLHAEGDVTPAWVELYDDEVRHGGPVSGTDHPVLVGGESLMSPSPVPRYDALRLDRLAHPVLLGAGRLARISALPPWTPVRPLAFADRPLAPERAGGPCDRCASERSYRVEVERGEGVWHCSDVDACAERAGR